MQYIMYQLVPALCLTKLNIQTQVSVCLVFFIHIFLKSSLTYMVVLDFKIKLCGFEQHLAAQRESLRFKPHCNYYCMCAVRVVMNHDQRTLQVGQQMALTHHKYSKEKVSPSW